MRGRFGRRLALGGLAGLLAVTGALPGITGVAIADTVADVVTGIDTTLWSPDAPGLSGVAFRSPDRLIVVDMQNHDFAGFDGTNLWEYSFTTNQVVYTGSILPDSQDDPTGVAYDAATDTLFVSSDSTMSVYVIKPGPDGKFGTGGDAPSPIELPSSGDVEDPAFNPVNKHLYVLAGGGSITDFDPGIDLAFGTVDDPAPTSFNIPTNLDDDELIDVESLAYDLATGNLLAGARFDSVIYEFTTAGVFVQEHDLSEVPINSLSGLTAQPAVAPLPITYWLAERGTDSTTVSDGALYRVTFGPAPDLPNNAPVLAPIPSPIVASQGVPVTFDANAGDVDFGQTLTYSLHPTLPAAPPASATINSSSGAFTWTPSAAGSVTVRVVVTDNGTNPGVLTDTQDVVINVGAVNTPPTILGGPFEPLHSEGEPVNFDFTSSDPDGPAPTWSATGLPPGLSIGLNNGTVTGTVAAGATGNSPYAVTITVSDGTGQDQETMDWEITNTNAHAPVLANITNKSVAQGNQLAFNASATDADGHGVSFSLVSPPAGAAITAGGHFTWTPSQAPGNYNVTIKASDNGTPVRSDQQTFVVSVQNDPNPDSLDPFVDDDGHVFENAIEWLDAQGITSGCNPPVNDRFCPNDHVTRGQMAAFLVRALHYSDGGNVNYFSDDNGHVFENAINRLRTAGVTQGCNPPTNNRYCPNAFVTRGQMAAFLVRALGYTAGGSTNYFTDDNGSVYETAINRLRTAGVTLGCNPPVNDHYCPNAQVTRGQMAAFLQRALGG